MAEQTGDTVTLFTIIGVLVLGLVSITEFDRGPPNGSLPVHNEPGGGAPRGAAALARGPAAFLKVK